MDLIGGEEVSKSKKKKQKAKLKKKADTESKQKEISGADDVESDIKEGKVLVEEEKIELLVSGAKDRIAASTTKMSAASTSAILPPSKKSVAVASVPHVVQIV